MNEVIKQTENFTITQTGNADFTLVHSSGFSMSDPVLTTLLDRFAEYCENQLVSAQTNITTIEQIVKDMEEELGIAEKKATVKTMKAVAKEYEDILQQTVLELDAYSRFVSPRKTTSFDYDENKAIEWCLENLPDAVKMSLLKSAFEQEAKKRAGTAEAIPFVAITTSQSATMSRKAITEAVEDAIVEREESRGF